MSPTPAKVIPALARCRLAKPAQPSADPRRSPRVCAIRGTVPAAPGICPPAGIPGATLSLSAVRHG
jgi:hypothetical protein